MKHAINQHWERRLPDLPMPIAVAPVEDEKPSGPPTEGMRNITAIVGMAASMGESAKRCDTPTALGNVTAGNNATTPPASQRVSGLNAGALAGLAGGLAKLSDLKKSAPNNHPAPQKESNPVSQSGTKPSSPKPASASPQKNDLLEPDWEKTPQRKTAKTEASPSKAACDTQSQSCPQQAVSIAAPSESAPVAAASECAPTAAASDPIQSVPESTT